MDHDRECEYKPQAHANLLPTREQKNQQQEDEEKKKPITKVLKSIDLTLSVMCLL